MILNDLAAQHFVIPFALGEKIVNAPRPLIYRPWGTRTIKLKITAGAAVPGLWLRPQRVLPEEAALGIYKAYADDSRALHITWGGGHENGPCVKAQDALGAIETSAPLGPDDSSCVFFSLTHAGAQLPPSATATLRAFERRPASPGPRPGERRGEPSAVELDWSRLCLPIRLPADLPPLHDIMRVVPGERANNWVVSPGRYLPGYDSRWWPSGEVRYEPSERPPLVLRVENGALLIEWMEPGHTIAVIEDYTRPSVLLLAETVHFELFAFDRWSVALRVWFFWVDKYVGGSFIVGRHEVPDAERFDMIIRREDGRVLLAATDLHWREVWARVLPGKILHATLGLSRATAIQLAKEKWAETWNEIWVRALHRPGGSVEAEHPNNPVEPFIRRLAEREATMTVKATGTEAHIPSLHNVEQRRPAAMTSSDVRLG